MSITYIAFIECVIEKSSWFPQSIAPTYDPTQKNEYKSYLDNAEIRLVDIVGTRRYLSFKRDVKVHIVNNVFVYDSEFAEDITVDESKQFPKKKRMDE